MPGRPPKPDFLRALAGGGATNVAHETLPKSAPLTNADEPPSALNLTLAARRIWNEVLALLPIGLILKSDVLEFGRYCQLLSDRDELRDVLRMRGRTILLKDEKGAIRGEKARPELSALHKVESELRLLGNLLGLTPSARQRVSVSAPSENEGKVSRFFRPTS